MQSSTTLAVCPCMRVAQGRSRRKGSNGRHRATFIISQRDKKTLLNVQCCRQPNDNICNSSGFPVTATSTAISGPQLASLPASASPEQLHIQCTVSLHCLICDKNRPRPTPSEECRLDCLHAWSGSDLLLLQFSVPVASHLTVPVQMSLLHSLPALPLRPDLKSPTSSLTQLQLACLHASGQQNLRTPLTTALAQPLSPVPVTPTQNRTAVLGASIPCSLPTREIVKTQPVSFSGLYAVVRSVSSLSHYVPNANSAISRLANLQSLRELCLEPRPSLNMHMQPRPRPTAVTLTQHTGLTSSAQQEWRSHRNIAHRCQRQQRLHMQSYTEVCLETRPSLIMFPASANRSDPDKLQTLCSEFPLHVYACPHS